MGVFALAFDQSGSRLLTCEADKTIKIYKEDDTAVSFFLNICLNR
jgi:pleiotropic regulator 1